MAKGTNAQGPILTQAMVKSIVELAVQEGIKAYHKEAEGQKKLAFDKRLRNTKLLLKNFRELAAHSDSAVFELSQVSDEDAYDILERMVGDTGDVDMQVESIKKSAGRTRIIVEHTREMLRLYQIACERSQKPEDLRRFHTIERLYLDESSCTIQDIADDYGIDVRTSYTDLSEGIKRLTALIFGIDGLTR